MNHCHTELIEDPQWVSYCVDNRCSFRDNIHGSVCRVHCTRHICTGSSCSLIRQMAAYTASSSGSASGDTVSSCPVTDLLVFHKPQVEFRGSYYTPHDNIEFGYGGLECTPNLKHHHSEVEINQSVLNASLPAIVALFSTVLTERFTKEYDIVNNTPGAPASGGPVFSWMTEIYELARQLELQPRATFCCSRDKMTIVYNATLKTVAAIVTLFDSTNEKVVRFMKKLACKYNDKHGTKMEFYTMVVMVTLCLFPYLKHRVLGELLNNRTLVIMCFDKTVTRHNQWSALSTHIHLHANQPEFVKKVLSDSDVERLLPVIITVTLQKYVSDGMYQEEKDALSGGAGRQRAPFSTDAASSTNNDAKLVRPSKVTDGHDIARGRKRTSPTSTGYYEEHNARLQKKLVRVQKDF